MKSKAARDNGLLHHYFRFGLLMPIASCGGHARQNVLRVAVRIRLTPCKLKCAHENHNYMYLK
ncbi:hypothetical protein D3C79_120760 [compost metagenome]